MQLFEKPYFEESSWQRKTRFTYFAFMQNMSRKEIENVVYFPSCTKNFTQYLYKIVDVMNNDLIVNNFAIRFFKS